MPRMTQQRTDARYAVDMSAIQIDAGLVIGEAIERLALFENALEDLISGQDRIARELDALRQQGKQKSVRFRELLGEKMINGNLIALFRARGL